MRNHSAVTLLSALCILVAALLSPATINAQEFNAAFMRGTVTDPSGAVIPGARVTATDILTRVSTSALTDDKGRYIFQKLMPAPYAITVTAQGFKTLVRRGVVLRVGQQTGLDFKLEVGSVTQTVSVTGAPPLLNTESGALSTVVSNQYIMNLPIDMNHLIYLTPGVSQVSGGSISDLGGTSFSSNGQRYGTASFRIDGTLATHPEGGEGSVTIMDYEPAIEDVQEFSIQNNSFSAEYGNNGGTVVNFVTKSGTNQFHGMGWYYMGRPGFDAQDFFSNMAGIPKASFATDQYGASLGGPIRRDKTFFFFDLEGQRNNTPLSNVTTVPTKAQRNGDFSQTFNADGTLNQIFNPCPVVAGGNPVPCSLTPFNSSGSTDYLRQPFPGNIIPAGDIDPVMQKVINLYPLPNVPGDPVTGFNNYTYQLVTRSPVYQGDVKIDQNFSARNRLLFKYAQSNTYYSQPDPFLGAQKSPIFTHDATLEDDWTLDPSTLWVNRLGLARYFENQHAIRSVDPLSLGFPKGLILNPSMDENNFPFIQPSNYQSLVADAGTTDTREGTTQWDIESKVTKVIGGHNLKFGGERQIFLDNFFQPSDTSGNLSYGPDVTAQDVFSPGPNQGNSLASMLLGWGDPSYVTVYPAVADKSSATAFYIQDDWKTTQRLTLNLGLRYEWNTPYEERYNREQFSLFNGKSGITVPEMCDPGFMAQFNVCSWPGKQLVGTTQLATPSHRHADPQYTNFAPRLGFAYRLTPNTVVRGGGGVYYGMNFATNWQYGGTAWNAT
ncbi:MAG: TonB-dependent receptor domain-containing protein, partial [Terriglobia bacterium]